MCLKYVLGFFAFTILICALMKYIRDREHEQSITDIKLRALEEDEAEQKLKKR